jgi:hypothetical protein
VSANRIRQLLDTDAGDDLIIPSNLQEALAEDIILVGSHKGRDVSDYCQHIEFVAFNCMVGEEDVMKFEVKQMIAHHSHHLVGLHVVHVEDVEVVETVVEGLADLEAKIHHLVEEPHFLELHHSHQIVQLSHERTYSFQLLDQHRTC